MRASFADHGFTLVELVVVIVILGILGSIAMPRFFDNVAFEERGYYEELVAALKFAQKVAVATGCPVRVAIDAAGYEAKQQSAAAGRCDPTDTSWSTAVMLADGQALAGAVPQGVFVTPATLTFDALGRPGLGADQAITVGPHTLVVRADSGFVDAP